MFGFRSFFGYLKRNRGNYKPSLIGNPSKLKICLASFTFITVASVYDYNPRAPPQDFLADTKTTKEGHSVAPWQIPHAEKAQKGGEDTYFISSDGLTFGVFDGVGGWAKRGVDSREYSYTLSQSCKEAADAKTRPVDLVQVLEEGWKKASGVVGSCTACLASVNNNTLTIANLGDSGAIVIRGDDVILRTVEQQFSFNFPYQLGSNNRSVPRDASILSIILKDNDVVILGSDGVFDNIYDEQIVEVVRKYKYGTAQEIAMKVSEEAYKKSISVSSVPVPFYVAAEKSGKKAKLSGKEDDITVVVLKFNPTDEL